MMRITKHVPLMICLTMGICQTGLLEAQVLEYSGKKKARDAATVKKQKTEFLRVTESTTGDPLSMQTAITRYRPDRGDLVIDLIGAVHIGEGAYYEALNKQFENYDVLLYELVAPEGTRIPTGGKKARSNSPLDIVSWMQSQAKQTLGLESQLEKVDYQKKNFVHADMSPTDISNKMAERGDTALTVGLSAMAEMLRQQNKQAKSGQSQLANQLANESLFDLMNNPLKLKQMMAGQFTASGVMDMGLGDTLNQLLIDDRNAAVMKVLNREIIAGHKKIGIFYGAAHMPDFEKRLASDLGMKMTKQVWLDAWDLTKAGTAKKQSPTSLLFDMLNELSK